MVNGEQIEITQTILNQLGGKKFTMMTGAKHHTAVDNGVSFKIGRNSSSCNTVTITYDHGQDLYNMTFEKVSLNRKTLDVTRKLINRSEGVFGDKLQYIFTSVTGMCTHL